MCRFLVYAGLQKPILMADLVTKPSHSIIMQSYASRERIESPLNGDGFGVGWYTLSSRAPVDEGDREPCVFTSVTPAWNNMNLVCSDRWLLGVHMYRSTLTTPLSQYRLAQKVQSPMIFGHVRAASPGTMTSEANCHPFAHQRLMWMHNGMVSGFASIKRNIVNHLSDYTFGLLQGTTDSEHCFMLFLECFFTLRASALGCAKDSYQLDKSEECNPQMIKRAVVQTIGLLHQWLTAANIREQSLLNFAGMMMMMMI
jgi:glutamine amidotransferase